MFAVITKIAWTLLQPSSLLAFAAGVGIRQLRRGRPVSAFRWLAGAFTALLVFGLAPVGDLLIMPLESRFPRPDLSGASVDGLIVLGGAEDTRVASSRGVVAVNEAAERYIEAVVLARRFPTARIVFTGGGEALSGVSETEAATASRIFQQLGVDADRLTLEDKSRTTWENAAFLVPLLQRKPGERWLLVTSAWQMPRAVGVFRKAGFHVEAYPVDYRTTGAFKPWQFGSSLSEGWRRLDTIAREYPALLIYRLTGRTSVLFPGP